LTLIQNEKIERFPLVAMGSQFWGNVRQFVQDSLVAEKTISPEDLQLLHLTDSVEEAVTIIKQGIPKSAAAALRRNRSTQRRR
jgi:hypothetical protein